MTQVQLAEQVGVQALWVSQFERGKATAQIGLVLRTLKTLNIPLHLGETDTAIKSLDSTDNTSDRSKPSLSLNDVIEQHTQH